MRRLSLALVALASLSLCTAAWALPGVTTTLGTGAIVLPERSFDLAGTRDHLPAFHVAAGWTFDIPQGHLDLDLGYWTATSSAQALAAPTASLWLRGLELGVAYRYPLWRFFQPYARIAGGLDWVTLGLGSVGGEDLSQTVTHFSATGTLGFNVPIVLTESDSGAKHEWLLIDVGAGYAFRPEYHFDSVGPRPVDHPPADSVARTPIDLGSMPLSSIVYRVALTFRL